LWVKQSRNQHDNAILALPLQILNWLELIKIQTASGWCWSEHLPQQHWSQEGGPDHSQ